MIVYILLSKQSDKPIEVIKVYDTEQKAITDLEMLKKVSKDTKFRILTSELDKSTTSVRRVKIAKDEIQYSVEFERFWSAYPKKTAKGEAYQTWGKVNIPLADVLKALDWQVQSEQWRKGEGQFISMPSTYLNQRRWEDEKANTPPVLTVIKHNCEYEGCDKPSNLNTERGRRCVNHMSK